MKMLARRLVEIVFELMFSSAQKIAVRFSQDHASTRAVVDFSIHARLDGFTVLESYRYIRGRCIFSRVTRISHDRPADFGCLDSHLTDHQRTVQQRSTNNEEGNLPTKG